MLLSRNQKLKIHMLIKNLVCRPFRTHRDELGNLWGLLNILTSGSLSEIPLQAQRVGSEEPSALGLGQRVQTGDSRAGLSLQDVFCLARAALAEFKRVANV